VYAISAFQSRRKGTYNLDSEKLASIKESEIGHYVAEATDLGHQLQEDSTDVVEANLLAQNAISTQAATYSIPTPRKLVLNLPQLRAQSVANNLARRYNNQARFLVAVNPASSISRANSI
jgi:hypothetical protein